MPDDMTDDATGSTDAPEWAVELLESQREQLRVTRELLDAVREGEA